MSSEESSVNLKLFIDNKRGVVLLAEADKEFVDALFYEIVHTDTHFDLLRQTAASCGSTCVVKLCNSIDNLYPEPPGSGKTYCCLSCFRSFRYYVDDPMACPTCHVKMMEIPDYVESPTTELPAGIYVITDDLEIKPMSTLSMMNLMFSVDGVDAVEEKAVKLSFDEVAKLVRACVHSKKVLTDFFLNKLADADSDTEADGIRKEELVVDGVKREEEFVVVDGDEAAWC